MTNQELNDHYVYALYDSNRIIRYIGEGRGLRYLSKNRSSKFLSILNDGGVVEKLYEGLTKSEALTRESELIYKHKDTVINIRNSSVINTLTYEFCSKYFEISSESPTGLVWKINKGKVVKIGKQAGSVDVLGYYRVGVNKTYYKNHRIVWVLHNQKDLEPHLVIDHLDGNKSNNRPENLEAVSVLENNERCRRSSVLFKPKAMSFVASARRNGRSIYKSFSINKYGEEEAFRLAKEALTSFYC